MDAQKQPEPTMEEILASIRRIISEDPPEAGSDAKSDGASDGADDVLELTEIIPDDPPPRPPAPQSPPEPPAGVRLSSQDEIDAIMNMDAVPAAQPSPPPLPPIEVAPRPSFGPQPTDDDLPAVQPRAEIARDEAAAERGPGERTLLSGVAAAASTAAFADLSSLVRPTGDLGALGVGSGATLDDLVREMLRPLLKSWLDANLPSVVERLVQREIERIARDARRP